MKATIHHIVQVFSKLSAAEKLTVLQLLIHKISLPIITEKEVNPSYNLLSLAGTGKGVYGNVDDYLASERDWN